jgi:hypothetical protein
LYCRAASKKNIHHGGTEAVKKPRLKIVNTFLNENLSFKFAISDV